MGRAGAGRQTLRGEEEYGVAAIGRGIDGGSAQLGRVMEHAVVALVDARLGPPQLAGKSSFSFHGTGVLGRVMESRYRILARGDDGCGWR